MLLEFKNVSKKFGKVVALSDISFKVDAGEFVFICGESGAGKTTLLKLITRELSPDEGEVFFKGEKLSKLSTGEIAKIRQKMGVVFQDFKLLPEKTVRENIEIALGVVGVSPSEWKARVEHILQLVEIPGKEDFFPSQLSGGEVQRVTLARALVVNPEMILADEPTGNLDWETATRIIDIFDKVNKEGKTIIMATHHELLVERMKKRKIVLKKGKVVKDGK